MTFEKKVDFALHGNGIGIFTFGCLCFGRTRGSSRTAHCFDVL